MQTKVKKFKFTSNDLSIVIPSVEISENLLQTIDSIKKSSCRPKEIVLVLPKSEKNKNSFKKIKVFYVKKKNQIYQRNFGVSKISKRSKLLLQLDDSVLLTRDCLKNLIQSWNNVNHSIKGIGLNPTGRIFKPQSNIFQRLTLTNSNSEGIILDSGFAIGWNSQKKDFYPEWLNGGWTSWNLKKIRHIKNRKFPQINWCVGEDVVMSLLNYAPRCYLISHKSKVKVLKKKNNSMYKKFMEGYLHSKITHSYVRIFEKLSLAAFYYAILSSSFLGIIKSIITFNFRDVFRFFGRFLGMFTFFQTKNFK